eukprot:7103132-Pyramimonas_sp.AAC.1
MPTVVRGAILGRFILGSGGGKSRVADPKGASGALSGPPTRNSHGVLPFSSCAVARAEVWCGICPELRR